MEIIIEVKNGTPFSSLTGRREDESGVTYYVQPLYSSVDGITPGGVDMKSGNYLDPRIDSVTEYLLSR